MKLRKDSYGRKSSAQNGPYDNNKKSSSSHRRRSSGRKSDVRRFCTLESTEERNKCEDEELCGPHADVRKELDYSYHAHYRKERQWLHDSIIDGILDNAASSSSSSSSSSPQKDSPLSFSDIRPAHPWLIYTVGVKGAGKRHTIERLVTEQRLNLLSFVFVDADEIRRGLPEYRSYVSKSPEQVGELTRKECGYVSEVLVLAALKSGRNVIWDCSLQNAKWHVKNCSRLRERFPSLKIALIHVTAPSEAIKKRVQEHSKITKRLIPFDDIDKNLKQLTTSVEELKSDVDYYSRIENDEELRLQEDKWERFTSTFNQEECLEKNKKHRRSVSMEERKVALDSSHRSVSLRSKFFRAHRSTEENHQSNDRRFYGKYAHIRAKMDYTYHCNYTYERQKFQDAVISNFLNTTVVTDKHSGVRGMNPTEPWIVFTAGAMGAGKSYTMNRMNEMGRFPISAFVNVDPDEMRRHLPEFHVYVEESAELAGELTRKEAGFMSEILTLAGLEAGRNVMVDGSLRDSVWYQSYFGQLRKEYPKLRIAIIHVTAPREAVFQRAFERSLSTGRVVPKDVLEAALEQVPKSVNVLGPLADYFVELCNEANTSDIELTTKGETWESFESKWRQTCAWIPHKRELFLPFLRIEDRFHLGGPD